MSRTEPKKAGAGGQAAAAAGTGDGGAGGGTGAGGVDPTAAGGAGGVDPAGAGGARRGDSGGASGADRATQVTEADGQPVRWRADYPEAVRWAPDGSAVDILDQTRLPEVSSWLRLRTAAEVAEAIRRLQVRGAPAIGVAGAMGVALELAQATSLSADAFREKLRATAKLLRSARPTAVNLAWAVDRTAAAAEAGLADAPSGQSGGPGAGEAIGAPGASGDVAAAAWRAWDEADRIHEEDRAMCRRIGEHGLGLFPTETDRPVRVMTVCNAGALATGGMGTALAPVYLAHAEGRAVRVWSLETRPLLQGSRITAWELDRAEIPVTVIVDAAAADVMARGEVDLVITGADRIAANGDVANKVGTYALAVLARHHGIPFYVAAPWSTVDLATPSGADIPIEERDADEVRRGFGRLTAPEQVPVWSPAFDVAPAGLVTAIVTDRGIVRPPLAEGLARLAAGA